MSRTKIISLIILLVFMLSSCIIPYEPNIDIKDVNKYVVSGQVSDQSELQTVSVSMASPVGEPQFIPVTGCFIRIFDDRGNVFTMRETETGKYQGRIDRTYLTPGTSFKVEIMTADGISLESDFDKMSECPAVDSIYYFRKDPIRDEKGVVTQGIQFYLNMDGSNSNTHFFRWEVIETWEYHSDFPREWYYDGRVHHIFPPDYSRQICWATEPVKNIYTLSTENLSENKYSMLPINYIDNNTPKLKYGYSMIVNQYAMSEAAYAYWDQLRINSSEQGGLYEKQPLSISGNLHNNTNPEQRVLGFFSVSSVKSKRIFLRNLENFTLNFDTYCSPSKLERFGFRELDPIDYPAFLMGDEFGYRMIFLNPECVDCLSLGGTNIKPAYWPY